MHLDCPSNAKTHDLNVSFKFIILNNVDFKSYVNEWDREILPADKMSNNGIKLRT